MFVKYGKNGLASAINNASASIAIMIQNYGILSLADYKGWNTVVWLWVVMLVACGMLAAVAFPLWRRFKKERV